MFDLIKFVFAIVLSIFWRIGRVLAVGESNYKFVASREDSQYLFFENHLYKKSRTGKQGGVNFI